MQAVDNLSILHAGGSTLHDSANNLERRKNVRQQIFKKARLPKRFFVLLKKLACRNPMDGTGNTKNPDEN